MLAKFQDAASLFAALAWGPWLLALLLGGGLFFLIFSRAAPFRYLGHGWRLLRGHYDEEGPGRLSHFQALASALAGTIGTSNIGGVALAITIGGPGAIFWMWVTAVIGIATKFFTCSLAVMHRGRDSAGELQGGPMYVVREGLHRRWRFLAYLFAGAGLVGCLPAFQANQLTQILRDLLFVGTGWSEQLAHALRGFLFDQGWVADGWAPERFNAGVVFGFNLTVGVLLALGAGAVILGGLSRIAGTAARLVPFMTVLYLGGALIALALNIDKVPAVAALILRDAFTGEAAAGGALLMMILYGVRRGAFSNEAGMGTEAMAHGAARTQEPIREGLVAMLGPIIDTLLVCSATAFVILTAGVWRPGGEVSGVTLTADSFAALLGPAGSIMVVLSVLCFGVTTIFTYSFYGTQCAGFLFGAHRRRRYLWVYLAFIVVAAIITPTTAINIIDGAFALMAIPTMVSALILAPKVKAAATIYFASLREGGR